jgi:hypothetical protein
MAPDIAKVDTDRDLNLGLPAWDFSNEVMPWLLHGNSLLLLHLSGVNERIGDFAPIDPGRGIPKLPPRGKVKLFLRSCSKRMLNTFALISPLKHS